MNKILLSVLVPPLAVCRFGCAGCCAAPIGVFWLTGIVSLVYGYLGGPLAQDSVSWNTVALGIALWLIAVVWTLITIRNVDEEKCAPKNHAICNKISRGNPVLDEHDPLEEVRRTH